MFWYIIYILWLAKGQEQEIITDEYAMLMYTVSKIHPHIHYILGDMIPAS